jgi:hypothetical protein
MLIESIRERITLRSFWLGVQHPELSRAELRSRAAAELAAEHRSHQQVRLDRASHRPGQWQPPPHPDPVVNSLIRKVCAVIARLHVEKPPPRVRIHDTPLTASPAVPAPQPTPPRPSIVERIADLVTEPEPPAEPPQRPMIRSEGSSAVLIPDAEFPARYCDQATANWRASVESNIVHFEQRRGGPKRSWYIG